MAPPASATGTDHTALATSLQRVQERAGVLQPPLRSIVESCALLFGVDGSGVMLADAGGVPRYVVATGGRGALLGRAQRDAGQGPSVDAFAGGRVTSCASIRADPRYPVLVTRLAGHPVDSVLCAPLQLARTVVGTLDVHAARARAWSDAEGDALRRYAEITEAVLGAAVSADRAGELAAQLHHALDHRAPIERGVGYLMARDGLERTAAFQRLRSAARSSRRRIGQVAEELLASGRLPGE